MNSRGRIKSKLRRWRDLFKFACARGATPGNSVRLFYHSIIKPSLVFRGWRAYAPGRVLAFRLRSGPGRTFQVQARDNGVEVATLAEFFSAQNSMLPHDLPHLQPRVVYDLGANVGIASLYFSESFPGARFYAFEPVPGNFALCQHNYRNLEGTGSKVFPWAVGEQSGTSTFECTSDPRAGRLGAEASPAGNRIKVQVVSVSDLIEVHKLEPPEFIKIDVEGAEMDVLRGMARHLQSVRRIFLETHGAALKAECTKWMQDHGFEVRFAPDPNVIWGDKF